MRAVMLALLPGTLLHAWLIDGRVLLVLATCALAALVAEALALTLRRRLVTSTLLDGSALLSAWLLALCLPPSLPLWQVVIGAAVMILLGKQVFGGLGQNPFNPAMLGFAFLIVSFPVTMTDWSGIASFDDWRGAANMITSVDGVSGATPLDRSVTMDPSVAGARADWATRAERTLSSPWPWVALAWFAAGLWLLWQKLIDWRLPAGFLASIVTLHLLSLLMRGDAMTLASLFALPLSGALMFTAVFVITDPVTAPSSHGARWFYGALAGALCWSLREFSSYPEGAAFAVLLANATVPLIDHVSLRSPGR